MAILAVYLRRLSAGTKKNMESEIDKVMSEQINIASASPRCSASTPIINEPIGRKPKNVSV